eukprot:g9484.t1
MRTKISAGAKRPRAEPTPNPTAAVVAIMVLKMLGSAAAVLGGGGGGGGGGHNSSRALVAASVSTSALSSARSLFGFRACVGSSSSSSSSSGAFVRRLPLLAGRTPDQQQHKRCSSGVHQRRDRGQPSAAIATMPSSGGTTGCFGETLRSSTSGSNRLPPHRLASSPSRHHHRHRRHHLGGSIGPRLMSMVTGGQGEGKGFWTDDGEFEEPPSTLRDRGSTVSTGATSGGYGASWETPPAGAGEAGFLQEEEDEAEWMAGQEVDPEAEAIFFGHKVPFADLGLSPALCGHLEALGIGHSTAVQAAAVPGILSGEDLIVGAETGSGKTLAYLLPIVERLLRGQAVAKDLPNELLGNARGWAMFPDVVVLVPNKELCDQVHSVLRGILKALDADGNTDITAAAMYGSSYEYPFSPNKPAPSVLVCTPSFLHKYTNMKAIPLFCKATTLVMDEADMLMEGSYKKQLDDILIAFRRADRVMVQVEEDSLVDGRVRRRGIDKTQYVLAAATLPTYGLKSVDQYIKRAFPQARKIEQDHMHKHHPAIQQEFVEVGGQVFDKIQAVIDLLRESVSETDTSRTMVFTNTAASCKRAFEALAEEGFSVVPYHKDTVPLERLANLHALRSGRAKILVCTDLAARGIDVPSVTNIIQMEMATNVVQHLHRLGRAARAGRTGKATNFYDDSTKDLVNSITAAGEGSRLDGSFSRQRGFRKKFKKYGPGRNYQGGRGGPA